MSYNEVIIGGSGYIGYHLSKLYPDALIIDKQKPEFKCNYKKVDVIKEDLKLHLKNADLVFYLAGESVGKNREGENKELYDINIKLAERVLADIPKKAKFIFPSTHTIYEGLMTPLEIGEALPPCPLSSYSKSKAKIEGIIKDLSKNYIILRLGTSYGYSGKSTRFDLMPNLFCQLGALKGKLKVFNEGKQYKPLVSVKDVARCMKFLAESKIQNEIYHISNEGMTVKEVAEIVKEFIPNLIIENSPEKATPGYTFNCSKLRETGFKFKDDIKSVFGSMILRWKTTQLFYIPSHNINTGNFNNLLYDKNVDELEKKIADYVGAEYAVSTSSASNAIFLSLKYFSEEENCKIPTMITPRPVHYMAHAGKGIEFVDNVDWIGRDYEICKGIVDSAHRLDPNQYEDYDDETLCIFSFYPTKPLGGACGGMVVSNDKSKIDLIRSATRHGENYSTSSWDAKSGFRGYQMFLPTLQAHIILENFKKYPRKRDKLDEIRNWYTQDIPNHRDNGSYHLFTIEVKDNQEFIERMKQKKITCGIHYKPIHLEKLYKLDKEFPKSERLGNKIVSLPFHEKLYKEEVQKIIRETKERNEAFL